MIQENTVIYSNNGEIIFGNITKHKDLAIEIIKQSVSFYFFHNNESIIIGSLIGIKNTKDNEGKIIFFQESPKNLFFTDIHDGFINYFKKVSTEIENVFGQEYYPVSIGDEFIDFNYLIERLKRYSTNNNKNKKSEIHRLIGKLLVQDIGLDRKITIKSLDILSTLYFLISTFNSFPHLLYIFSIVMAKNSFNKPIDVIFLKSTDFFDYDIDSNILMQSEIESRVYSNLFTLYYTRLKNKNFLSHHLLHEQIMKFFPLGSIGNKQNWSNINKNKDLKYLVDKIIRTQFFPTVIYQFLWGYKNLNKSDRQDFLTNIKSDPFYGKIFFDEFSHIMKGDSILIEYFNKNYQDIFFKNGYESGKNEINWKQTIIIIILLIIIILFLASLYIIPDFYKSLLDQFSTISIR